MLAMTSSGSTCAASQGEARGAQPIATQSFRGATYTLHGREIDSPDAHDLFDLPLPAHFGAPLLRDPVFWSWDAASAPTEADVAAMLTHLLSEERRQPDPIIIRDVLSVAPSRNELPCDDDDDDALSEQSFSDSESVASHSTTLSDAEEDVIHLIDNPPGLEE